MFFITLFKSLGDHLRCFDRDVDTTKGIVHVKKAMHEETNAIACSYYIGMKYSFCLLKGCRSLNHSRKLSSSQYRGSLSALYVDISMAPHRYAGDSESLLIFSPWLHVLQPGRLFKGHAFASAASPCNKQHMVKWPNKEFFEEQQRESATCNNGLETNPITSPACFQEGKASPTTKWYKLPLLWSIQFNLMCL